MTVNEQVHVPEKGMVTRDSDLSEMRVHVQIPGKPPGPMQELVKNEESLEWLGKDNNYCGHKTSYGERGPETHKRRGTPSCCSQNLHKEVNLSSARKGLQ